MEHVVLGIEDSRITVQLAAVTCLHSVSRSVQQLRTTFQDNAVWKPLMKLLQGASEEVLTVASSAVCNLLLEFSPSKEVTVWNNSKRVCSCFVNSCVYHGSKINLYFGSSVRGKGGN